MLTVVDEFTRECLAIDVARKLTSEEVLERLSDLFIRRVDGGSKWRRGAAEFGGAVLVKFSERREWCVAGEV